MIPDTPKELYNMPTILSETQREEIYEKYVEGDSKASLARMYAVSPRTIGRVISAVEVDRSEIHIEEYVESSTIVDDRTEEEDMYWDDGESQWEDSMDDSDDDLWEDDLEEEEPSYEYHVVATAVSIAITRVDEDGEVRSASIIPEDENFEEASKIVWAGRGSQESLEEAFNIIDRATFFEAYSNGKITVDPELGRVYYKTPHYEQEFSGRLVNRLIDYLKEGKTDELENLCKFAERLALNESQNSIDDLYNFLEAKCIEIDSEGYVIAFKKVRDNYMDIHSGTFDNSPGQIPEVPRRSVDANSNKTCSYGLHVCSSSYLGHFGGCNSRVVMVKVDPKDFVAVPRDYNDAKARVCRYEVLKDVTEQF